MKRMLFAAALATACAASFAQTPALPTSKAPAGAEAYIISPADGATVGREVTVRFGLKGMGVAPAGVAKEHTGHHHLLIDVAPPAMDEPIPNDKNHLHFGGGLTEARIELPPGRHTLQLLLGDTDHVPHNPPLLSNKITVIVPPP